MVIDTLRRVRRRFLPAHVRVDIRDTQLLEPDSDCLDVGAHAGSVPREVVRLAPLGYEVSGLDGDGPYAATASRRSSRAANA